MHLEGTTIIRAPRQVVWEFLTDPTKVAQCAPGVESVNVLEVGKRFQATAAIGFGSVKARFTGEAEFLEMDIPNRAKIKAHGNATGSAADVMSEMVLSDGPDGATDLKWSADVAVVGQIASLAARLMTPISQKLTGLFFDEVRKRIEAPAAPGPGPKSSTRSAASITAGSCSTTTSVLPARLRRCMASVMRSMSRGCRPMLGSSSTNRVLTRDVPSAVVRLMRCTSPPLSVRLCRSSVR